MISIYTILTIARYESKVLLRSWFFRIFSVLALALLVFINVGVFTNRYSPWMLRGIPSCIPYLNILLVNVVQAVIGVFMASDFLKYDSKLDTTDVIYMRSMTNADYVFGKTLGVLAVFGGLNIIVLVISFVFNVFFADVPLVPEVYVLYPLLISLPTLVFIFGLSFMSMVIIRSQALTFIILLGYIAVTLFFLGQKFHYLFDYMAFSVPLMYSGFVGFGDITTILTHRGIYFLFGTSFIFITILLLRRLPQSRIMNYISIVIAVSCLAGGIKLGHSYLSRLFTGQELRTEMKALNHESARLPKLTVRSHGIDLEHTGDRISVTSQLVFLNETDNPAERYTFSLNPGLQVTSVNRGGKELPFTRNLHILTIEPSKPLEPGEADSLTVVYHGAINEDACFIDADEEKREEYNRILFFNIDKRYSFITPDYVLLTPENLWYPVAGVPYGSVYPELKTRNFTAFALSVKTFEQLTAVSQGAVSSQKAGEFHFSPESELPCLSLAIGRYEKKSITVDDVEYALFVLEGHDYFSEYFDKLEKFDETISTIRNDFEFKLGLDYQFKRLSLIETPIQFFAYQRLWTVSTETVQPEQVLLPEKGITLGQADFKRNKDRMTRGFRRGRGGQGNQSTMTPEEMQGNLARQFCSSLVTDSSARSRMMRMRVGRRFFGEPNYVGNYLVFPSFYTYVYHTSSDKWPIFNVALEYYLNSRILGPASPFMRNITGLSSTEQANYTLMDKSLADVLADPEKKDDVYNVLETKCSYLFSLIKSELGEDEFSEFLKDYLDSRVFTDSSAEEFVSSLDDEFVFDLEPHFDSWMNSNRLPAFAIGEVKGYEFFDWESTRFQINLKVTNLEPVDGLISVTFRTGGRSGRGGGRGMMMFGGGGGSEDVKRVYLIEADQTKEIGIILDESPRSMSVDTFISQNLPSVFEQWFEKLEKNDDIDTFDDAIDSDTPITLTEPGEIVVDNEDPGFEVSALSKESFLKRVINSRKQDAEEDYVGLQFWRPPRRWKATTSGNFFGLVRHSAQYIRAGKGENKVSWKADIPQNGNYKVYYYTSQVMPQWMSGRGGRGGGRSGEGGRGGRGGGDFIQDFHFFVHHDDGVEEVELDMSDPQVGWNLLGTYYFSPGPAKIELTDLSKGRMVYADAVKWVEAK